MIGFIRRPAESKEKIQLAALVWCMATCPGLVTPQKLEELVSQHRWGPELCDLLNRMQGGTYEEGI